MPIRLFKDFVDGRICFYWSEDGGRQVSPAFATLQEAQEWWKRYLFSQFTGWEKRRSIHDRRSDFDKRQRVNRMRMASDFAHYGRRVSDQPIRIDQDMAAEKIRLLKQVATESKSLNQSRH